MREVVATLSGAAAGFLAGLLLVEQPSQLFPFVTAMLGAVLTQAVRRYARF